MTEATTRQDSTDQRSDDPASAFAARRRSLRHRRAGGGLTGSTWSVPFGKSRISACSEDVGTPMISMQT